ncbi:hypothetical protein ACHAXT_011578 [Thalassiosira profunda]
MSQAMSLRKCLQFCLLGQAGAFRAATAPAIRRIPSAGRRQTCELMAVDAPSDKAIGSMKRKYSSISGGIRGSGSPNRDGEDAYDPVCRVVATSDGKISRLPATASLSQSSQSLLEKIELLYSVQSQKELRDLAYVLPRSADENGDQDELPFDAMEETEGGAVNGMPRANTFGGAEQEEKLISILEKSLDDGGFKLMDQRDMDLCSALNAGYLLRLSLLPDVKELDPCIGLEFYPELYGQNEEGEKITTPTQENSLLFDGRVLIFRRGYSKEITTGRLLLQKLDYLQASLVQRSSTAVTRRLGAIEQRVESFVLDILSQLNEQLQGFAINLLENFGLTKNEFVASFLSRGDNSNNTSDEEDTVQSSETLPYSRRNKIFKLGRYRTATSAIPDAIDLDDALSPFLLCEVGEDTAEGHVEQDIVDEIDSEKILCQYDDTLFSIENSTSDAVESSYKPAAVRLLERVSIQNTVNFLSKKGRRELVKNYFRSSTLVEPAYEEVIAIWRPLRKKKRQPIQPPKWLYQAAEVFDVENKLPERRNDTAADDGPLPLEIKAFYDVPMANVEAVLPKTRLVFRPADAIVFDLVSVVSFLAVAGSVKFDSPKLDLIALVSLVFFAVRTFFRYSNKYARYDLLVNKFLTQKISHRGPGALKYIVSEANSNRALRAMLIRDWLSNEEVSRAAKVDSLDDAILRQAKSYVNERSSLGASQIDVDVLSALEDLQRLGLIDGSAVKEEQEAKDAIKQLWDEALE